jgi:hypothetical protein
MAASHVVVHVSLDKPHTRLQSGVSKPKKFTDGICLFLLYW